MDALLILGGLLLLLVGVVWLVMTAFSTSLLWGWGVIVVPPLSLVFLLKYWQRARKTLALMALGCIPIIVGLVLMASRDPVRLEALLSLRWLHTDQAENALHIALDGELNGQRFRPQHAELINGVLSLREGDDFFAQREVKIHLGRDLAASRPLRLDVLPSDEGAKPRIEISWLLPDEDLPEAWQLEHGYSLHLNLEALGDNLLAGDFHLVLPSTYATGLSGQLQLFTSRLRYSNGKVERSHDSRETLHWVAEDYLQRRFASRDVLLDAIPEPSFPSDRFEFAAKARVLGRDQLLPLVLRKTERGWQVEGDHYPALPVVTAPASAPELVAEAQSARLDRRVRFSLARLQRNPQHYAQLRMRVSRLQGGVFEGHFIGIDADGSLQLSRKLGAGGGSASVRVGLDEIADIDLLDP